MTRTSLILCLLAMTSAGCQQPATEDASTPASEPAPSADSSTGAGAEPEVEYEPAYPTDVSSEPLSKDDVAQQKTTHSHDGGEEHSHDEEDHGKSGEEARDGHQH